MKGQLLKFKEETGLTLEVKDGKPYFKGSLLLRGTGITALPDNFSVGGWLDLSGTGITSLPDNITVGGSLDIRGTGITSLPDNLTVGGYLDIRGTRITSLPDNLTVGGWLGISGTGITDTRKVNRETPELLQWRNYGYIKADGIFSKVVSRHGNVYKIIQIGGSKERYLVTDGSGKWSHGDTLQEAKEDLIYKISNRDKSRYASLTLDSELTLEEAIEAYRVITGACSAGTKMFVEGNPGVIKEKYTVREMIEVTDGQYNSREFKGFFNK